MIFILHSKAIFAIVPKFLLDESTLTKFKAPSIHLLFNDGCIYATHVKLSWEGLIEEGTKYCDYRLGLQWSRNLININI